MKVDSTLGSSLLLGRLLLRWAKGFCQAKPMGAVNNHAGTSANKVAEHNLFINARPLCYKCLRLTKSEALTFAQANNQEDLPVGGAGGS